MGLIDGALGEVAGSRLDRKGGDAHELVYTGASAALSSAQPAQVIELGTQAQVVV